MPGLFLLLFLGLVALTLIATAVGFSWFERQRKKQVEKMLATVTAKPVEQPTILLDPVKKKDLFEQLLKQANISDKISSLLYQAGLNWTVQTFLVASFVAAVAGVIFGYFLVQRGTPGFLLPCTAAGFAFFPLGFARFKRGKRLAAFEAQFPEALDFLGRAMRAGHAFSVSFELICEEMADPLGKEFRTFFNEQNLGAPLETAMENLVRRVPLVDVRFFASAVILQRQTGGNLAEILNRLAFVIRERFRLKGHVKAASAHGRMTSTILTLLPIGTALGLMFVSPGYLQGMASDPTGKKLIIAAAIGVVLAFLIMRKITNIEV